MATPAATSRKASTKKARFNPADLPTTGTGQYRQNGGDYRTPLSAIGAFAKGDDKNKAHWKALIHLGWAKLGGENTESKSDAFVFPNETYGQLPAECWTVGGSAADQISANLTALAEAGAPAEALDALWAVYVATKAAPAKEEEAEGDVL